MINESRFGHVKGSNEFSIYGFGVKSNTQAGPAEKYDRQVTEIDARYVIPPATNEAEVQISVSITNQYLTCHDGPVKRSINMLAGMALKPADAEQLAIALAPQLGGVSQLLKEMKVDSVEEATKAIIELRDEMAIASVEGFAPEPYFWVQVRSHGGNWVDRTGIPSGHPASLARVKSAVEYELQSLSKDDVRVIRKYVEVITL